jgi:hypothetical protein
MTISTLGETADAITHVNRADVDSKIIRFQLGMEAPKRLPLLPDFHGDSSQILSVSVNWLLPRKHHGLRWSDFPAMKTPVFSHGFGFLAYSHGSRKFVQTQHTAAEIQEMMSAQSAFFYDETTRQTHFTLKHIVENRFFAARLHKRFAAGKPFLVRYRGEPEFRKASPRKLADQSAGWHRYHHNYKLNFEAIGCKAIDHVIARYSSLPKPKPIVDGMPYRERINAEQLPNRQAGYFKYRHTFLTEPYGLQTLFTLRNASEAERSELFQFFASWPRRDPDGPQMTFGGHVHRGVWRGSGKYDVGLHLQDEIGWAIHDGVPLGLVDVETDDKISLTDAGNALLDMMHTDNYDPDAFLRFTDAETQTMPASQIERIDAWMGRFFGKMKTKVDRLS